MATGTSEALPEASFPAAASVIRERQEWFQSSHALEMIHLSEASSSETHQTHGSSKDILCCNLLLLIEEEKHGSFPALQVIRQFHIVRSVGYAQ